MRFLLYEDLRMQKGIPYSDRQLKRLEARGVFPKRVPLAVGGSIKGWPDTVIPLRPELIDQYNSCGAIPLSDDDLALKFAAKHESELRHVDDWG